MTTVLELAEIKLITEESLVELGHLIENPALGRRSEEAITVMDLTGVAIQDIQIAKIVDRARRYDKHQRGTTQDDSPARQVR